MFPWQLTLFQSPPTLFQSVGYFQHKKHKLVPQTQANIFICLLDHTYEAPLANIKMECQRWPEKPLILGRSGTQYVAIAMKLLSSFCRAHLVESYCRESNISDTNWPRYPSSSYLMKIWFECLHLCKLILLQFLVGLIKLLGQSYAD